MSLQLRSEIDQANEIVKARDAQILENQKKEQELRDKLQKNYKDFIAMDATIVQLRKEALKGTEAAESRNDMLQRNLDKLAFDFEGTTKNLRAATLKIKELEFEMEEIVSQFNQTGEAKKKSEELNLRIAADLAQTSAELRSTKEDLDQTLIIKARLEADLRKSQEDASVMQKNLEAKIVHLTQDLSTALSLKTDLEYTVRQLKAEIDKVNANAKALAKAKETVEQNMRAAQIKSDREIQNRDTKITTFENMRADDAKLIKKLQDAKEQARSQVTELQTSLDREVSNMNVLSFETAQFKRHAEERISNLEDQLEKMTLAKSNLSNDKVQLLEKIKSMRIEIKSKEDELEFTKVAYKKQGEEALASDMRFRGLVVGLESDLKALNGDHEGLTQEFITLQLNFKNITNDLEYTRQQLSDLGVKHDNSVNRVSQLESRNEYLMKEHSQAVQERAEMKIHLESVLSKNEELMISSRHLETELTDKLKRATAQITKMSNEMMNTRDEEARLKVLATALKELSTKLDTELATTRTKLSDEIQTREGIEHDLFEVRKSLTYERNRRLEVEKMQSRLGRSDELRSLERLSLFKMRDYKLGVIYEDLSTQLTHLTKFVEMLPEGLEFGETDVKPIALFNTTSGGTNGKKEGGKELLRKAADHVGPKGQSPIERSLRARKSSKGTNGQKCP